MAAPLQRARLQFGKGTDAAQGRIQWLALPVASLRSIAEIVAQEAKVPVERIELHLQEGLLAPGSDPRLIRDGETIVASVPEKEARQQTAGPLSSVTAAKPKAPAAKRKQLSSSSSPSSSSSDSDMPAPQRKPLAKRKAPPSSSSSSTSSSSSSSSDSDQRPAKKKAPALKRSAKSKPAEPQSLLAAQPPAAAGTPSPISAGFPVHVPLPPPFPLRSPIPLNPSLTLPGLPLPSPGSQQPMTSPKPKGNATRRENNGTHAASEKCAPVTVAQKGYVRFDDDGNVVEERAAAAPQLSRDHIQAQKRRGTAVAQKGAPRFDLQQQVPHATLARRKGQRAFSAEHAEEAEEGQVEAETEEAPSLANVGQASQRAYENFPPLEGFPAAGDTIAWLYMTVEGGMRTEWREGKAEPDYEVGRDNLLSARKVAAGGGGSAIPAAASPATAPVVPPTVVLEVEQPRDSALPPANPQKRGRTRFAGIGRLVARLQRDTT